MRLSEWTLISQSQKSHSDRLLDHDKEGKTAIRISMNGSPVYSGKNQASKTGWTVLEYPVRAKMLRQGENTLEIRNLEKKITNGNWFMISGAEIIRK